MSKAKRLIPAAAAALFAAALTGCSGINASHSVSPASFFLPGLVENQSLAPVDGPVCVPPGQVAMLVDPLS
jgi:hypothetical protein